MALACSIVLLLWAAGTSAQDKQLEPMTLQLKWKHQFQFAGYYMAQERGYYRDAGLQVNFVEAQEGLDPVDEVVEGRADVGVGTTELLLERARGRPVVVLAVIYQHSPLALAVRSDRGVENIHQLAGRRVMIEPGSAELLALLAREHVAGAVTILPHTFSIDEVASGRVDGASVYVTDEPWALDRLGVPYVLFSARQAGVDFYGDNLFTTEKQLARRPEAIAAFRQASLHGWKTALAEPEAAVDVILSKYSQRKSREHLLFEAKHTSALVLPDVVDPGYMYLGRWQHIADTYAEQGLLTKPVDLHRFVYSSPVRAPIPLWLWLSLSAAVVVAIVIAGFSISLLRAKRKILRSEQQLRDFIDRAPTPIMVSSPQTGRVQYMNERAAVALGTTREEAIGRAAEEFYVNPDERVKVLESCARGAGVTDQELQLRRTDGAVLLGLVSSGISLFEGAPALISGFVDLTERRRLEQELRGAVDEIRTLQGIIPICAYCKRIRNDAGSWEQVERYVADHSQAEFSHGICPSCERAHFPESPPVEHDG